MYVRNTCYCQISSRFISVTFPTFLLQEERALAFDRRTYGREGESRRTKVLQADSRARQKDEVRKEPLVTDTGNQGSLYSPRAALLNTNSALNSVSQSTQILLQKNKEESSGWRNLEENSPITSTTITSKFQNWIISRETLGFRTKEEKDGWMIEDNFKTMSQLIYEAQLKQIAISRNRPELYLFFRGAHQSCPFAGMMNLTGAFLSSRSKIVIHKSSAIMQVTLQHFHTHGVIDNGCESSLICNARFNDSSRRSTL